MTSRLEDVIEFATNPERRCPVILLLDNSYSMSGEPIQQLNQGVALFKQAIEEDDTASLRVEIAIVTFGAQPMVVQNFTTVDGLNVPTLQASGNTPMGQAIELALDRLEERKQTYKANGIDYYQPWILLISDGAPTDDYTRAAQRVRKASAERKLSFYPIAVKNADRDVLSKIAPPNTPPLPLDGLKFKELFRWLSASVSKTVRHDVGEQVDCEDISGWTRRSA